MSIYSKVLVGAALLVQTSLASDRFNYQGLNLPKRSKGIKQSLATNLA